MLGRLGWGMSVNVLKSFTNHGIIKTYCKDCRGSCLLLGEGRDRVRAYREYITLTFLTLHFEGKQ